jgi:arylformamidase
LIFGNSPDGWQRARIRHSEQPFQGKIMAEKNADFYNNEYNPRVRAPQHETIKIGWQTRSAAARQKLSAHLDLRYGAGAGETIDVFPAKNSGSPVFVFIHGGYWRGLDKSDFSFLAPSLIGAGAAVFMPNYALAPKVSVEHIVRQVISAVWWIYKNAETYGGDPRRIVVAGHSAGAHMAALLMAVAWPTWQGAAAPEVIQSVLAISGVYDLRPLVHASFLNDDLKLDEARAANLSPALLSPTGSARVWTCVGGEESAEFHRQNALIAAQWPQKFGGDIAMPGFNHFDVVDELENPESPLYRAALQLLGLAA